MTPTVDPGSESRESIEASLEVLPFVASPVSSVLAYFEGGSSAEGSLGRSPRARVLNGFLGLGSWVFDGDRSTAAGAGSASLVSDGLGLSAGDWSSTALDRVVLEGVDARGGFRLPAVGGAPDGRGLGTWNSPESLGLLEREPALLALPDGWGREASDLRFSSSFSRTIAGVDTGFSGGESSSASSSDCSGFGRSTSSP